MPVVYDPLFISVAYVWGRTQYLLDIVVCSSIIHVFSHAFTSWENHLVFNQYWVYPTSAIVREPAFHHSAGTLQSHNGGRNSAAIKQCWELVRNVNDIAPIVSDVSSIVLTVVSQLKKCWGACMMKPMPVYCNMLHQEQLTALMLQVVYVCGKENWVLKPSVHSSANCSCIVSTGCVNIAGKAENEWFTAVWGKRWLLLTCAGNKARSVSPALI